ncbi:MAG: phage fiber-tail adaptor protein [Acetobacter cibinongensis]
MTAPLPSPGWQPAPERSVPLGLAPSLRVRGLLAESLSLSWCPKSSADTLDFSLDATAWLQDTTDYLASISATVSSATGLPTDLRVQWVSLVSGMACLFLAGGAPGTIQTVLVTLGTQQGRSLTQPVRIAILPDVPATQPPAPPQLPDGTPVPPNALALSSSVVLTADNGKPYLIA